MVGDDLQLFFPPEVRDQVQLWASEFELIQTQRRPLDASGFFLWWRGGRLELYRDRDPHGVCLQPAEVTRRATLRGELARACGASASHRPRVLDAMAGIGLDGMTLCALGCAVVLMERDLMLCALLDSYLGMFVAKDFDARIEHADTWDWLAGTTPSDRDFEVIYLDPMFGSRRKGALPGKAMQFLAELTTPDSHPLKDWVELARRPPVARVVLKRRLQDPMVGTPDWQIKGRSVRYDVYRGVNT